MKKYIDFKLKLDDLRRIIIDERQRLDRRKLLLMVNDIDKLLTEEAK